MSRLRRNMKVVSLIALTLFLSVGYLVSVRLGIAQDNGLSQAPATPTALGPAIPPEVSGNPNDWPVPTGDYAAHRAAANSAISTSNISELNVDWSFPINAQSGFGAVTAVPIVIGDTIYIQDMLSNVFALDRASGQVKWQRDYNVGTEGPNGVSVAYGRVFGSIGNTAQVFALDSTNGKELWKIKLTNNDQTGVDMAPTVYNNVVYISTVPGNSVNFYRGGQKGILYAIDAGTGAELWDSDTSENLWGNARINSGGGLGIRPQSTQTGISTSEPGNAAPWPGVVPNGTPYANGSSRPGNNDYASSMVRSIRVRARFAGT